jgi:hypothetical protein
VLLNCEHIVGPPLVVPLDELVVDVVHAVAEHAPLQQ